MLWQTIKHRAMSLRGVALSGLVVALFAGAGCSSGPSESRVISRQTIGTLAPTAAPVPESVPEATQLPLREPADDLPGQPSPITPRSGSSLSVVGVGGGSYLNVRALPGTEYSVIDTVAAADSNLIATGRAQILDSGSDSIWYEVTTVSGSGWASSQFLSFTGRTTPGRSQFLELDETFDAAVDVVAQVRTNSQAAGEGSIDVTVVDGPTSNGSSQIMVIDITGFADDAVLGNRLRVIGDPGPRGSFVVVGIESTLLCRRGVTADALCA